MTPHDRAMQVHVSTRSYSMIHMDDPRQRPCRRRGRTSPDSHPEQPAVRPGPGAGLHREWTLLEDHLRETEIHGRQRQPPAGSRRKRHGPQRERVPVQVQRTTSRSTRSRLRLRPSVPGPKARGRRLAFHLSAAGKSSPLALRALLFEERVEMFYFYCSTTPCTTPVRRPTPPGRGARRRRYDTRWTTPRPPSSADLGVVPYDRERRCS